MHFGKQYRYRFGDIDHAGIAYYPRFFHYFHCAFEDWWADGLGTAYPELMGVHDLGFPVVNVDADFFAPIRYGDDPSVHVGVLRAGKSSLTLGFWMQLEDATPLVRCRARITTVAASMANGAKRELPERWRAELLRFQLDAGEFPERP